MKQEAMINEGNTTIMEQVQTGPTPRQTVQAGKWIIVLLSGLSMCFYLGWAYQGNWYWYYGINAAQLDLPVFTIFEQGAALSLLSCGLMLVLFGVILLLRLLVLALRNLFSRERRSDLTSLFSIRDIFQQNIHFVVLVYVVLIYLFLQQVEIHNSSSPKLEVPANIVMLETFILPAAAILFLRWLGDLLYSIPERFRDRLRLTSGSRVNDEPVRVILGVLVLFAVTVKFTGNMAIGDASVGFRQNSSYQAVRRVYLKSYLPIAGLEPYRQGCDCSPYVYGPLGYLQEKDEYLFLIPWKADGEEEFSQFPPLYQIERSSTNTINIIPDGVVPQPASPPSTG